MDRSGRFFRLMGFVLILDLFLLVVKPATAQRPMLPGSPAGLPRSLKNQNHPGYRPRLLAASDQGSWMYLPLIFSQYSLRRIQLVSVAPDGTQANRGSSEPSISTDGRYVAFVSGASNLAPGDENGNIIDVFVHDTLTGVNEIISKAYDGGPANTSSNSGMISADGRYVAYPSNAYNLVPGDTNGIFDVFLYDRHTGTTVRASVASDGSQGNAGSATPSISADGRYYVAFYSYATNLTPSDLNGKTDIFVYDRETGTTELVSVASDGTQGDGDSTFPSISADGRFVAFSSKATQLVSDDTNAAPDVFVHDRQTGVTERVSVASDGSQGGGGGSFSAISPDGRFVAFVSAAGNLVSDDTNLIGDIFIHDRQTGITERVSVDSNGVQANYESSYPTISADGRLVAFHSLATNLVLDDTNGTYDIFVHDRETALTELVSVGRDGSPANNIAVDPWISADGRYISFASTASNLVLNDTNDWIDVFVMDRGPAGSYSSR